MESVTSGAGDRIVDSFETYVPRPSQNERQKRLYSGKKKRHTLKTQIYTDQDGGILSVGKASRGPKADIKIYEAEPIAALLTDKPRMGDKASCDGKHPEIETPLKKPKGESIERRTTCCEQGGVEEAGASRTWDQKSERVENRARRISDAIGVVHLGHRSRCWTDPVCNNRRLAG